MSKSCYTSCMPLLANK